MPKPALEARILAARGAGDDPGLRARRDMGAQLRDLPRRPRHNPGHPAASWGNGVLGRHRIRQDRRVHRTTTTALGKEWEHRLYAEQDPDAVDTRRADQVADLGCGQR